MQISKSGESVLNIKCKEGMVRADTRGVEIEGLLFSGPGEYERKGIFVEGLEPDGLGTIFLVHAEDMNICYAAEIRGVLSAGSVKSLGDIDILIITIDTDNGLNAKDAEKTISTIDPRVIVTTKVSPDIDVQSSFAVNREDMDVFRFKKSDLPSEDRRLIVIS